jgi:hypothetical protein
VAGMTRYPDNGPGTAKMPGPLYFVRHSYVLAREWTFPLRIPYARTARAGTAHARAGRSFRTAPPVAHRDGQDSAPGVVVPSAGGVGLRAGGLRTVAALRGAAVRARGVRGFGAGLGS